MLLLSILEIAATDNFWFKVAQGNNKGEQVVHLGKPRMLARPQEDRAEVWGKCSRVQETQRHKNTAQSWLDSVRSLSADGADGA